MKKEYLCRLYYSYLCFWMAWQFILSSSSKHRLWALEKLSWLSWFGPGHLISRYLLEKSFLREVSPYPHNSALSHTLAQTFIAEGHDAVIVLSGLNCCFQLTLVTKHGNASRPPQGNFAVQSSLPPLWFSGSVYPASTATSLFSSWFREMKSPEWLCDHSF